MVQCGPEGDVARSPCSQHLHFKILEQALNPTRVTVKPEDLKPGSENEAGSPLAVYR